MWNGVPIAGEGYKNTIEVESKNPIQRFMSLF